MNEKYGIELELITSKFKEKVNKIKDSFQSIGKQKIDMSKQVKMDSLARQFELASNQVESLRHKLKGLNAELASKQQWEVGTKSYIKLQNEINKTSLQLEKAGIKADTLNDKITLIENTNLSKGLGQTTASFVKGIDKMTSKIKRFGLSLLSIRSIWALVSRASSAYLIQDTVLADKMQSVWAGLGAMLAPIIEGIVNILAKAVKYINIFIKALTGVDLLAKATTKSIGATAGSAKSLNKALAGFDELTNLDTDAGGSGGDFGLGGLEDVKIEARWADKIRTFGEWVKKNAPEIKSLLTGITGSIIALKLGLGGMKSLGIGVAISGIIYSLQGVLDYLKDGTWTNFGKIIQGIGVAIAGFGAIIASVPVAVTGAVILIIGTITKYWEQIRNFLQSGIDWLVSKTEWVRDKFGLIGETIYTIFTSLLQGVLNIFNSIFTTIKGVFDGLINFIAGVFTGDWSRAWEGIKQIFSSVWNGIKDIISSVWNFIKSVFNSMVNLVKGVVNTIWSAVKGVINLIIKGINVLIRGMNKISFTAPDWVPGLGGKQFGINIKEIPLLNVGTNYVPEDQLAYIHKGEAVVPKKFNSQEYFGNGNDETNSLLNQVIEAIKNIELNPYTTIKDVGQTAVNYINEKSRQYGRSVI